MRSSSPCELSPSPGTSFPTWPSLVEAMYDSYSRMRAKSRPAVVRGFGAESGEMIRFSYRVLDEDKAAPLNDKKLEPSLIDPRVGVKLVVPSLEQVGLLRQSSTPHAGKMYWMAFSNKGRLVKPGDHVNVVIGGFRAIGLVVE